MRRHRYEAGRYRDLLHPCTHVETMNASCSTFDSVQEWTTSLPSSSCVLNLSICVSRTRAHTRTHALTIEALTYTAFLLLFPFSRVSCPPLRLMYGALCRCSPLPASPSLPPSLLSSPANSDEPRASSAASITYLTSSKVHCAPARARACSNSIRAFQRSIFPRT